MSIEKVIDFLKSKKKLYSKMDESGRKDYVMECLDTAINLISNMTDGDSISRQAVLSKIKEVCFSEEWVQFRVDYGHNGQRDFLINYIEQLPPVTPQPCEDAISRQTALSMQYRIDDSAALSTRDWARVGARVDLVECTSCGYRVDVESYTYPTGNYCPNCGAKMKGEEL